MRSIRRLRTRTSVAESCMAGADGGATGLVRNMPQATAAAGTDGCARKCASSALKSASRSK
ncbi:hypothetical protein EOE66_07485 [Rubrivivax rivuli]|uniref:Uncharacterized protein n=1 Tax=Rubrivivax rivuli TaxID=1862385 RepID=A0A437RLB0_9BURK|nr:hypothetical protein EOE66_07485 [Rubrivivax rivuli]